MNKKEKENVEDLNIKEYIYEPGQIIDFPGKLLEGLLEVLEGLEGNETSMNYIDTYAAKTEVVKNDEGKIVSVTSDWQGYPTAESFFNQKPQPTISYYGAVIRDQLMVLRGIHLDNIQKGKALKEGSIKKQDKDAEIKLG